MTGAVDYLSDGERVIAVENGHPYLGQVTGVCHTKVSIECIQETDDVFTRPAAPLAPFQAAS